MRISDWSSDVCSSDLRRLPAEDSQHLEAALGTEPVIAAVEGGLVRNRDAGAVTVEHGVLQPPGQVSAGVLQQRHQVVGGGTRDGVMEVQQATAGDAGAGRQVHQVVDVERSEEHTSELQSLMRNSYAGFMFKKKKNINIK